MATPELVTIREKLCARGISGITGLGRAIRRTSQTGKRSLNRSDFATFCDELGLNIDADLRERIFSQLDQEPTV